MAKKTQTIVTMIDDYDAKPVEEGLAETIEFTWEGDSFTIDLRPENASKFRKDVEKWVAASTKLSARRGRPKGSGSRPNTGSNRSPEELAAIRHWLRSQGHEVSDRGRIAANLQELFDKEYNKGS